MPESMGKEEIIKMKRIIIEVEPCESTSDKKITHHLSGLLVLVEDWAKDNFQNKPRVFLEKC